MSPTILSTPWSPLLKAVLLIGPLMLLAETGAAVPTSWVVTAGWWLLALVGVAGTALCSGMEMGSYTINRVRLNLRVLRTPPDHTARLLKRELDEPGRMVTTLLIGNNIFNSITATATAALFATADLSEFGLVVANFFVVAPALLIFGEAVPKELFRVEADRLTYLFARPLAVFRWVLTIIGVLQLVTWCAKFAERIAGLTGESVDGADNPRQRMALLLKEGALSGALSASQTTLVDRAVAMRDIKVEAEMIPWERVRFVRIDWEMDRVRRYAADQVSSRLPVVDRSGRVIGVLRQIDLHTKPLATLAQLMRDPPRLPPELPVPEALGVVMHSDARLGIVERHGRPIGIVSSRDLAEPLTGELSDW